MDGAILNQGARATGNSATRVWPAEAPTTFFSNGFWAVALFSAIGLAVSFGLSHGSLCTGIDVNIGCVPIEMTGQVAP